MKKIIIRITSVLLNLIEGTLAAVALLMSYAFIIEKDNPDHDIGLGLFVLIVWLAILLLPNILLSTKGRFAKAETVLLQLAPFTTGVALYLTYQLAN